ncbi:phage late control D family protein [Bartonella rattaustraliani]|uniref:phage late control D family protein n=1 Tax=Bartonella rattaustraliani TaxID=481139 RepID=UPI00031E1B7C|nr:contractile injection system protein, VgrG/Pvc8 family [Bartonella rattaustraliani]
MGLRRTHPFIEVKVGEKFVHEVFYQRLLTATITDHAGNEADSFEAEFDDSGHDLEIPSSNSALQVTFGYQNSIHAFMGRFVVESVVSIGGSDGEILRLCGKSASMRKELKEQASEHFDHKTIAEIVETLAKRHGYQAKVSPQFSKQALPYVVRTDQSAVDFLTRLADRMQARFLIKDHKFLFLSGDNLPSLTLYKYDCSNWEFTLEPRTQYGTIEAVYFDRAQGQQCQVKHQTGFTGPVRRLRTCYPCKREAQAAAASESERLCRAVGSGSLTLEGRPEIMADQPLLLQGFREEINGPWKAATVTHRYEKQSGYTTQITLEAPEKGKESNTEERLGWLPSQRG